MSRAPVTRLGILLLLATAAPSPPTQAEPQPSLLPGQPGGDPAPDTKAAHEQLLRGRYEDAITAAKHALQRDERYVPAMIVMAKAYYYLKKYELATSIIDISKGIDPSNAEAYHLLGFIALARDDKISAIAAFKRATELKSDYMNAWNNLAAQYLAAKNYDAAVEAAEKATNLAPNFAKAWLNLGSAYRGKARYADAENAYRKALSLNGSYPEAWFNLGILYLDAPTWPNLDVAAKLNTAIVNLAKYRDLMGPRLARDDPAEGYMEEARKAIDRERKRLERLEKQKERDKAKQAAPPAAAPHPAAGAAPPPPATPASPRPANAAPADDDGPGGIRSTPTPGATP